MKHYKGFAGVLLAALAIALFQAGQAFASASCFADTDGHWAESFICWLKDNGIAVGYGDGTFRPDRGISRGEMSVMLERTYDAANRYTDSQVGLPPTTGEIVVESGPGDWLINGPQGQFKTDYTLLFASITNPDADSGGLFMQYPNPLSVFNGRRLTVSGMDLCYQAWAQVWVDEVRLYNCTREAASDPTCQPLVIDTQDKILPGCQEYLFAPQPVDSLFVQVFGQWGPDGANRALSLSGIRLHLQSGELTGSLPE